VLKRLGIFCLILAGTILVTSSLIFWQGVASKDETVRIPKLLAGVGLSEVDHGVDAVKEITQLHQKDLGVVDGAMGVYGNNNQISLWVARFSTSAIADQMVSAMREKITPGKFPFSPTGSIQINDHTIYKLEGMGQNHYYFQSDSLVIWLAADGGLADQALKDVLNNYP
jgi:hypothetical protein